jgi:GntR family transcriptional repressor for pyruvate dehydrogenase complex
MQSLLKEIRKEKIFEDIVKQIQELIKSGDLKAGDRLPAERDMARIFRVSRSSVREALRVLESAGLIRSRIGDGTYVEAPFLQNLNGSLAALRPARRETLMEIASVRGRLEPQLALLAAERATAEDRARLRALFERQEQKIDDRRQFVSLSNSFHLCIAEVARSPVFLQFYTSLLGLIVQFQEGLTTKPAQAAAALQGHRSILEAIERRDPYAARAAMANHLRQLGQDLLASSQRALEGKQ